MENWILVKNLDGELIKVRQHRQYGDIFVDEDGKEYKASFLDFTEALCTFPEIKDSHFDELKEMIKSLDVKEQDNNRALIAEREYWRKLRGDIALEIIRKRGDKGHYDTASHFATIADITRVLFNELYDQDKEFFKDKDDDKAQ